MAIIEGAALADLISSVERKTKEAITRMEAEGRASPRIRMDEWLEMQPQVVADAVRSLLGKQKWRTVMFPEFLQTLGDVVRPVLARLAKGSRRVCFFVDDLHKSSFWVLVLALSIVPPSDRARLLASGRACLIVGTSNLEALSTLPRSTTVLVMDDASYSGEQLSTTCAIICRTWREAHPGVPPRVVVCVPYMSTMSKRLFKAPGIRLLSGETFRSMLQGQGVAKVLGKDLILEQRIHALGSRYDSLFFDFMGIKPVNTMMLFQHKFADSLSIPHRWLHVGKCMRMGRDVTHVWRVKPDKVAHLARVLEAELREEIGDDDRNDLPFSRFHLMHADVVQRMMHYMSSPAFRKRFMDVVYTHPPPSRAPKTTTRKRGPHVFPLLAPEYCSKGYQLYVAERMRVDGGRGLVHLPDCFRSPYKRSSYKKQARLPP